ncbi:hypothetical protein A1Q2_07850 [Trichosporon asahii var. asahii CBS 8904]|uniref:Uncharacterized protein n=1 Tax=Trichosporon asahii var. asahii (strain CBS 8904) TaxID=1220162 RepID=K1VM96_TRIAC|nr:hypothetical protein A1Q2_07850 [Trichosporon asahii var. asahii CBS 8904]
MLLQKRKQEGLGPGGAAVLLNTYSRPPWLAVKGFILRKQSDLRAFTSTSAQCALARSEGSASVQLLTCRSHNKGLAGSAALKLPPAPDQAKTTSSTHTQLVAPEWIEAITCFVSRACASAAVRLHHDQTDQGRQSAGELFVACQEKPISASTCIQLAFDTVVKVVKQRSTMGRQRTGHASNDPGLESRRTQSGRRAGERTGGRFRRPTHLAEWAQWPVAGGSPGSWLTVPPPAPPKTTASCLNASCLQATALPPRPDPLSLINHNPVILSPLLSPSPICTCTRLLHPDPHPSTATMAIYEGAAREAQGRPGEVRPEGRPPGQENFKKVAAMWKTAPENPKNKAL